ncbi:MAG: alpha/beta fold hydrolase [Spirochaetaceae bacterium]|nr:alpha/beta fold hydrolase [Spirochaetaceae bacterium]
MSAIIFFSLLFLGIILFSLVVGIIIFVRMFVHNKNDGSLEPDVVKKSLEQMKQSVPGTKLQGVKMQGTPHLSSHINDKKIMIPLLEAKLRWFNRLQRKEIEQITIRGTFGKKLWGNFIPSANKKSNFTVLLVHGYTDSAAGMAYLAEEYEKLGVSVLAIDCRAHGYSEGNIITLGYTDAKDVALWLDYLQSHVGGKIILHGVSMGGAAVIQSLVQKKTICNAQHIAFAVADCSFSSAKKVFKSQTAIFLGNSVFQKVLSYLIIQSVSLINFFVCGFTLGQNSPKKALKQRAKFATSKIPLLFFHGKDDSFISCDAAYELLEVAKENATLTIIEEAPHIGSYFYAPKDYMQKISGLISSE